MRQFSFSLLILIFLCAVSAANAQTSFAALAGSDQPVELDWRNPLMVLEFHLPPAPGAASLTIAARPMDTPAIDGSYFLLSVNQHPAVPFAPAARGFSARFDIPQGQLRPGMNQVELSFVSGKQQQCLGRQDGGWTINMKKSRFDLALNHPRPELSQIEDWLRADMGAPEVVAIEQGMLSFSAYQEFGATVMQALALRMKNIPKITANSNHADLVIRAVQAQTNNHPITMEQVSSIPHLSFRAPTESLQIGEAKWFAQNKITGVLPASANKLPTDLLPTPQPLRSLLQKTSVPAWRIISPPVEMRLPPIASARLQMDVRRPQIAGWASRLRLSIDRKQIAAPALLGEKNTLTFNLPASQSAARTFSVTSDMVPAGKAENHCPPFAAEVKTGPIAVSLQLAGIDALSELDKIAWNGGRFSSENGKNVQIFLPSTKSETLFQSWRVLAKLAKLGNSALIHADFGGKPDPAKSLLYIGKRSEVPAIINEELPKSFAIGAGRYPSEPEQEYKSPFMQSAFAASPITAAPGVAAAVKMPNEQVWAAISEIDESTKARALQDLADGRAIDHFSGNVVRWQGELVEINSTDPNLPGTFTLTEISLWNIMVLILLPGGLWAMVYLAKARKLAKFTRL